MKKLKVLLGIIIFLLLAIKLNAFGAENKEVERPLVVLRGDDMPDINYQGYRLLSSNLNMDVDGEYVNLYQNKSTLDVVSKPIYVVDKNDIYKKTYCIEKTSEIYKSLYKPLLIKKGNVANSYVIVYSKEVESSEADTVNIYMSYIVNGIVQFETLVLDNVQATLADLKIEQDRIIIACNVLFKYSGLDIYIGTYDLQGNLQVPKFYGGTGNDSAVSIIVDNNAYYIVGDTNSVNGEIGGNRSDLDVFIMRLNKDTLKIDNIYYYNQTGDNECKGAVILDSYIYMIQKYKDGVLRKLKIQKVGLNGELIMEVPFSTGVDVELVEFLIWDGTIVVVTNETTNKNISKVYMIDANLNVHEIDEFINDSTIIDGAYLEDEELTILYHVNDKNGSSTLIRKLNLIYEDETLSAMLNEKVSTFWISDNTIYKYNDGTIYNVSFSYLRVNNFGTTKIEDATTNINDYSIFIDGALTKLDAQKSRLEYDINLFGTYNGSYYFTNRNFDFMYSQSLQVLSNPNIRTNEVYDTNLILTFNASGLLNGRPISSGYLIKDEGTYTLKLIGKDNESVEYEFEVKKQSLTLPSTNTNNNELVEINEEIKKHPNQQLALHVDFDSNSNTGSTSTIWWPLFIPAFIGSVSLAVLIKGGLR